MNTRRSTRPLVIAHRGDSRQAPENTLPAFASAIQLGVDFVELDYQDTADRCPVVFHDRDLGRTTNAMEVLGRADIAIGALDRWRIESLDAGIWFSKEFAGTRVPTLAEALDVIHQGSRALIECKEGEPQVIVELLRAKDLVKDVVLQSFDWRYLAGCHSLEPALRLGALGDGAFEVDRLAEIPPGVSIIGWNHEHLSADAIQFIHDRGLAAWTYTVNEVERARELIDWKIDAIITDIPAEMPRP